MDTVKHPSKSKANGREKPTAKIEQHNYCTLIRTPERELPEGVNENRARMIILVQKKWANGTKLKYYFFKGAADGSPDSWKGDDAQKTVVKQAFDAWKAVGIGLEFEEVNNKNDAQIRIGFMRGNGSWSYVGRDVIDLVPSTSERTMNFGWNLVGEQDTAIHEIGHTLGAPHEHQNPNAGIVWNEEAVYNALAQPPNSWDRDKTYYNIIRKLPVSEVQGSTHDANSVMHYPFGPGLILSPVAYANGINPAGGISQFDRQYMKQFYPPLNGNSITTLKLGISQAMNIAAGEQKNFSFTPDLSRKYKIETFGTMDTLMLLYEKNGTEEIYLSGDDDSGTNFNSKIHTRLIRGREYIIKVRLYYAEQTGAGSVMVY